MKREYTDRELLELAAKAAGIELRFPLDGDLSPRDDSWNIWSPLEDDGDALRLSVKLQLSVCNEHVNAGAAYCTRDEEEFPVEYCMESGSSEVLPEDYVATRRAIVRAAACIGEAMP